MSVLRIPFGEGANEIHVGGLQAPIWYNTGAQVRLDGGGDALTLVVDRGELLTLQELAAIKELIEAYAPTGAPTALFQDGVEKPMDSIPPVDRSLG